MKRTITVDADRNPKLYKLLVEAHHSGDVVRADIDQYGETLERVRVNKAAYVTRPDDQALLGQFEVEVIPKLPKFKIDIRPGAGKTSRILTDLSKIERRMIDMATPPTFENMCSGKIKSLLDDGILKQAMLAGAYGMGENRFREMFMSEFPKHFNCTGAQTGRWSAQDIAWHKGNTMKSWKFKSTHPSDIDFDELAESVTRQNPIALVHGTHTVMKPVRRPAKDKKTGLIKYDDGTLRTKKGKLAKHPEGVTAKGDAQPLMVEVLEPHEVTENYVVVHNTLYRKSIVVAEQPPTSRDPSYKAPTARIFAGVALDDFPIWVEWAKSVKGSPWTDGDRRKASFTVDLPTI